MTVFYINKAKKGHERGEKDQRWKVRREISKNGI